MENGEWKIFNTYFVFNFQFSIFNFPFDAGKATKSLRWMPWYQQPMKDV